MRRKVYAILFLSVFFSNGMFEFAAVACSSVHRTNRTHGTGRMGRGEVLIPEAAVDQESLPPCHRKAIALQPEICSHCGAGCTMGRACDCTMGRHSGGTRDGLIFAAPSCSGDPATSAIPFPASVGFVFLHPDSNSQFSDAFKSSVIHSSAGSISKYAPEPATPPPK